MNPLLFPVHLCDNTSELGRFLGGQLVDLIPQSLLADGADLIHGNFSVLPGALYLQPAAPLGMQY